MKLTRYPNVNMSLEAWCWKLLSGPASILDGIVETITLGNWSLSARLTVSRNLSRARIDAMRQSKP